MNKLQENSKHLLEKIQIVNENLKSKQKLVDDRESQVTYWKSQHDHILGQNEIKIKQLGKTIEDLEIEKAGLEVRFEQLEQQFAQERRSPIDLKQQISQFEYPQRLEGHQNNYGLDEDSSDISVEDEKLNHLITMKKQKEVERMRKEEAEKQKSLLPKTIRICQDDQERKIIEEMNPNLIIQLRDFIDSLKSMKYEKALEVACGYGYVTDKILCNYFYEIQMFDQCPFAIDRVTKYFQNQRKITSISKKSMQTFEWDSEWNCIVFRYCVGYIEDNELVNVFKQAKKCLRGINSQQKRGACQESFIIVQDQVCQDDQMVEKQKEQRLRSQNQLEAIYKDAKLTVQKVTQPQTLKSKMWPLVCWALF